MSKTWYHLAWMRQLPRPVRNGRFYRLGHHIAVIMASHANQRDGSGIRVSPTTVANEGWCTVTEAEQAIRWLEQERWLLRVEGPYGAEWACNPEIINGDTNDDAARRQAAYRARKAKNVREYRERQKNGHSESEDVHNHPNVTGVSNHHPVTGPGNNEPGVTGVSNRCNRGELPLLPGDVTDVTGANGYIPSAQAYNNQNNRNNMNNPHDARASARTRARPQPSVDSSPAYTANFERFWKAYGRKGAKRKASTEWHKAIRRADEDTIVAAVAAYVASTPELRYRKDAERWLANDCWESAIVPAAATTNGHVPWRNPDDQSVYDQPLQARRTS